jgi:3-deoxy-manno-octulosonate cytidylyltransferase (CMP-KDO synthetase)
MHRVVVIIPARYNSTRFPGKPLSLLKGRPLIQHVYEGIKDARLIDEVFIATDDMRIYENAVSLGYNVLMTSNTHLSGTDRVAEVAENMDCDIVINVQGDEPFVRPDMVDDVVSTLLDDEMASISTLARKISDIKEALSPDVVKVVFDKQGYAMYFSRLPIPYHKELYRAEERKSESNLQTSKPPNLRASELCIFKHIGIYGYRKDILLKLTSLEPPEIERVEGLEQLRALYYGIRIKVKETVYDTIGIDTPEDLRRAEEWLSLSS